VYRFGSENPSVIDERFSSCMICSHFLFCLQEIIPKRFHQKLFSMLIPVLEDPEPRSVSSSLLIKLNVCSSCFRVHPHAASALINFCEGNERDTLLPYLDPIVERLLKLLDPAGDPGACPALRARAGVHHISHGCGCERGYFCKGD
jgi:hypothetical protein